MTLPYSILVPTLFFYLQWGWMTVVTWFENNRLPRGIFLPDISGNAHLPALGAIRLTSDIPPDHRSLLIEMCKRRE